MKTNQLMKVAIGDYTQEIEHKTFMGNLNSLWAYGNGLRVSKGLGELRLDTFLMMPDTVEFMLELERDLNPANRGIIKIEHDAYSRAKVVEGKFSSIITKRGKGGGTWAHLLLMVKAAATLDKRFEIDMYNTFINNKILQWRDDSGDQFIALNAAIDAYLPGRNGKDNVGIFIQCAKLLKEKIKPDNDNWNSASFAQLERRAKIESDLVKFLSLGMVRDYDHLKELIDKLFGISSV